MSTFLKQAVVDLAQIVTLVERIANLARDVEAGVTRPRDSDVEADLTVFADVMTDLCYVADDVYNGVTDVSESCIRDARERIAEAIETLRSRSESASVEGGE